MDQSDLGILLAAWETSDEGDLNCDGVTDQADLGAIRGAWDSEPGDFNWNPNADLDGDGHVYDGDLGILLADWGCGT